MIDAEYFRSNLLKFADRHCGFETSSSIAENVERAFVFGVVLRREECERLQTFAYLTMLYSRLKLTVVSVDGGAQTMTSAFGLPPARART